jgi:high-affinity Fe2+/Pb2+ permease
VEILMKVLSGVLVGLLGCLAIYCGLEETGTIPRILLSYDTAPKPIIGYVLMGVGVVAVVLGAFRAGGSETRHRPYDGDESSSEE